MHTDFLRDFRGDTIHPSTLELMYELGYLDDSIPFRELKQRAHVNARAKAAGAADDFSKRIRAGSPVPAR